MSLRPLRSFTVLLAPIFTLALAVPAVAQGVLSPPDGSGPSVTNYTPYTVAYLINGVRRDTTDDQETQIVCTNVGKNSVFWAVQVFDATGNLDCESAGNAPLWSGNVSVFTTDSTLDNFALSGTCPSGDSPGSLAVARVIVLGKGALMCTARVIDDATRNVVADLPVTPVGKPPKIKIKK